MKKVKRRYFFNYENEEKWLNEMADEGLHLVDYKVGKYTFEEGEAEKYTFRIQFMGNLSEKEKDEYYELMEDAGVEEVAEMMSWVIFRKKAADGPFEIFTDIPSKVKHFKTIINMLGLFAVLNLFLGIMNLLIGNIFNNYVSIISFSAVVLLVFVIINYMKRITKLHHENEY